MVEPDDASEDGGEDVSPADEAVAPDADDRGDPKAVTEGDTFTYTRSFTNAEVEAFVELSRDENPQHVESDDDGRLVVHGLLTGTLPTKIGGDLEYVARELNFTFHRPVYTGEAIRCRMTVTSVEDHDRGTRVRTTYECRDEDGTVVVTGDSDGVIFA